MIPEEKKVVPQLHNRHIKGTPKGAIVQNVQSFLCHLTNKVLKAMNEKVGRVYINTRVLKHVYDKRPAQEYDFFVEHLHKISKFPDYVYRNKDSKRGDYCFIKRLGGIKYLCSLELINDGEKSRFEVATFFLLSKEKYLDNYKVLWRWEDDGTLHRNAFDSGLTQPTNTPQ